MATENKDAELDSSVQVVGTAQGAVEAVRTASETVDDELTSIDTKTTEQATEMQQVVDDISSLTATIEEVTASAEEVAQRSEQAADDVESGYETAQEALDVLTDVTEIGASAAADVDRLEEQLDRIDDSLAGINEIADKTNMLALNASIEAARTQDGTGDGFAVVADEIKSLAEQSQQQADEVDELLDEVRAVATQTVSRLSRAIEALETGADRVEETMDSLGEVSEAVDKTAADVQSVSEATHQQAETSERVATSCESAAERADSIQEDIVRIRDARAEQTEMLLEIEDALSTVRGEATGHRQSYLQTGVDAIDSAGGLLEGGRSVLTHDDGAAVDSVIGTLCAKAISEGYAVSLTPTPTLDRETLKASLNEHSSQLSVQRTLETDKLFILDAFDSWNGHRNVFDLGKTTLENANEMTDRRRDRPLLVIGNIAGEITVLGEATARAARYDNDDGVLNESDTVLNVIDETTVEKSFAAFYTGAADQVIEIQQDGFGEQISVF